MLRPIPSLTKEMSMKKSLCASLILLGLLHAATAVAQTRAKAPAKRNGSTVIENCVSQDTVSFRPGRNGVMLELEDRVKVAAAIVARYPMMERDGLYPSAVALWRRPDGDWVYATVVAKQAPPFPSCYASTVTAGDFDMTPALLKKYFDIAPATPM
jgi:hypothetical protein